MRWTLILWLRFSSSACFSCYTAIECSFSISSLIKSVKCLLCCFCSLKWHSGLALITKKEALLWTDGRYFLQAEQELSDQWKLMRIGEDPAVDVWMADVSYQLLERILWCIWLISVKTDGKNLANDVFMWFIFVWPHWSIMLQLGSRITVFTSCHCW